MTADNLLPRRRRRLARVGSATCKVRPKPSRSLPSSLVFRCRTGGLELRQSPDGIQRRRLCLFFGQAISTAHQSQCCDVGILRQMRELPVMGLPDPGDASRYGFVSTNAAAVSHRRTPRDGAALSCRRIARDGPALSHQRTARNGASLSDRAGLSHRRIATDRPISILSEDSKDGPTLSRWRIAQNRVALSSRRLARDGTELSHQTIVRDGVALSCRRIAMEWPALSYRRIARSGAALSHRAGLSNRRIARGGALLSCQRTARTGPHRPVGG